MESGKGIIAENKERIDALERRLYKLEGRVSQQEGTCTRRKNGLKAAIAAIHAEVYNHLVLVRIKRLFHLTRR